MLLSELARCIGARVLTHESRAACIDIDRAYAANRMSELLERATCKTLLISELVNPHLLRVAELLDVPSICLVVSTPPAQTFLETAQEQGKVLLLSSRPLSETCRCIEEHGVACAS